MTMMNRKTEDDAKVPALTFELPRGYLLVEGDEVHRLNRATIREMTGEEEDIIAQEEKTFTERMHELVGSCMTSLSDGGSKSITSPKTLAKVTDHLLMSDLLTSIIRVREVTMGDEIRQKIKCPACTTLDGKPFIWTGVLSLKDFQGIPVDGDPLENIRTFTTSRGTILTWEMLTGQGELDQGKKKNKRERATLALMARVRSIGEESEPKRVKDLLRKLPYVERQEIRKQFDQEGGIETEFECVCRNCGHEFKAELDIGGKEFFFPSETSED